MADKSLIQWTESTWSPMRGCSRVSPGCENCYAEQIAGRFSGPGKPFHGFAQRGRATGGHAKWTRKVALLPEQLDIPLRWRAPRTVFVNSMSDTFHESLSNEDIAAVFGVMAACPRHTFQVLTKRAKRMAEWFAWVEAKSKECSPAQVCTEQACSLGVEAPRQAPLGKICAVEASWPLPNVHIGVSVEDQAGADERIPFLLGVPGAVHFLSVEPLLESVDLTRYLAVRSGACVCGDHLGGIGWVIVGGESGRKARPFDLAWARSIVKQCKDAGVACFVKQLGAHPVERRGCDDAIEPHTHHVKLKDSHGGDIAEFPEDLRVRERPTVAA